MILAQFLWHAFMQFNLFQSDNKINGRKAKRETLEMSSKQVFSFIKKNIYICHLNIVICQNVLNYKIRYQVTNFANSFKRQST